MFCPVCKAEYRQGFTRCADCDVELVYELPAAAIVPLAAATPGDSDEDPFCSFWTGDDPRIQAELCELMDKAKIPFKTVRREDHLFNISSYAAFQIGIPFSMFERAEAIVKDAYGSDEAIQPASHLLPMDSDLVTGRRCDSGGCDSGAEFARRSWWKTGEPAAAKASSDVREPGDSRDLDAERDYENGDAEDGMTEVWSGDEPELADFIAASLQTNEITVRRDPRAGKHALYVLPEDEARAREIVREVVECAPPE
ncbi:MAG: hypothetical protein WCE61_11515 [Candidatus Acidiferrum sp.]